VKPWLALLCLGALALFGQGVLALWVPARFLPDLGLLLVVAAAIGLRSAAGGVLFAAWLGYATDCLSGSLLGQQMLLSIATYGVARAAATRLSLRGPLPQAVFVTVLAAAHAAALGALVAFVSPQVSARVGVSDALVHAAVTGIAAPLVIEAVVRLLARLGEDEGQRPLRLAPRALAR
jgi:rod shape-determining protein MreD